MLCCDMIPGCTCEEGIDRGIGVSPPRGSERTAAAVTAVQQQYRKTFPLYSWSHTHETDISTERGYIRYTRVSTGMGNSYEALVRI